KSCSLLPKEDIPEEDPKAELEQRLQEYARCKKAAEMLSENSMYGKVYFREAIHEELPKPQANYSYSPLSLMNAYNRALRRIEGQKPLSSKHFNGIIGTEFISVASRVIHLLRLLIKNVRVSFTSVFKNSTSRSQTVATFLAVLELIRSGRVDIPDNNTDPENFDIVLVDNRPNRRKSS
ncbi:MAG: segregation/condensation protein A, partial [Clostridia bacterium]|nr:segregation/condensation protein A [Clostridia bacterium]